MFVKYPSGHCCRLAENDLHNTRYIKLFDGVKHFFSVEFCESVCLFCFKCDNTILSFLGSMTLTYFEILFAFFMTLTAWRKLVFL